jgi:asparagine synthase (glutamine-hydrolysing)
MCGIPGIIRRVDDLDLAALERMSKAMVHPGPERTWVSAPDLWRLVVKIRRKSPERLQQFQ